MELHYFVPIPTISTTILNDYVHCGCLHMQGVLEQKDEQEPVLDICLVKYLEKFYHKEKAVFQEIGIQK